MKEKHKNMLIGFLAAKSTQSSRSDEFDNILTTLVVFGITLLVTFITYFWLDTSFYMSEERIFGFVILTFFLSFFIVGTLFTRFPRFMYLLIFGPPVAYFLIWLFFLSS